MEEIRDLKNNLLNPGDIVVYADTYSPNSNNAFNNSYGLGLTFGKISHITGSGRLSLVSHDISSTRTLTQYRFPKQVLLYEKTNISD